MLTTVDDKQLRDGAPTAVLVRRRLVVDHHVGGERIKRRRVGVDNHRVGGANRLQVGSKLTSDVELVEEANEVVFEGVGGCIRCRLVGEVDLANEVAS